MEYLILILVVSRSIFGFSGVVSVECYGWKPSCTGEQIVVSEVAAHTVIDQLF